MLTNNENITEHDLRVRQHELTDLQFLYQRQEGYGKHAMDDGLAVARSPGERLAHMKGAVITRKRGKFRHHFLGNRESK